MEGDTWGGAKILQEKLAFVWSKSQLDLKIVFIDILLEFPRRNGSKTESKRKRSS